MADVQTQKANGIVSFDVAGAPQFTPTDGIFGQLGDSVTTLLSTQKVPVGNAALVQRLGLFAAGNMLATHSATGRLGISVAGRAFLMGS